MDVSNLFVVKAKGAAQSPPAPAAPTGAGLSEPAEAAATPPLASSAATPARVPAAPLPAVAGPSPASVGAFITPQSFASFPAASGLVTIAWLVCKQLFSWGNKIWVPAIFAFLVGLTIFLYNVSDAASAPKGRNAWFIAVVIAFFNSLFLLAAALGILPH